MKFKKIAVIISLCAVLCSCSARTSSTTDESNTASYVKSETYTQTINTLREENRLLADKLTAVEEKYSNLLDEFKNMQESSGENSSGSVGESNTSSGSVSETIQTVKFMLSDDKKSVVGAITPPPSITVPAIIDGNTVTEISDRAFMQSELENVVISEGIESIGWFAFNSSSLLKCVSIPKSVSYIGYSAFDYCAADFKIICYKDSYAQKYAESFGIKYELVS